MIDYKIKKYRKWLADNVKLTEAFSIPSLREIVFHLLMGRNYRLLTENNTRDKLLVTYVWLSDVVHNAKKTFGVGWQNELLQELLQLEKKTPEQNNILHWLLGLTAKGAVNLGLEQSNFPDVMAEMLKHCTKLFASINRTNKMNDAWLLLMAGSATLNIRGSEKSKIGKKLEKIFLRILLNLLGLETDKNFWMNIQRDREVEREADAEILTKRGRIRIEVGLIAPGNQEVIEDKINRVDRNGVVIFDKLGPQSRVHQTALSKGVKLVQIRNSQPLVDVYNHIEPLVDFKINHPVSSEQELHKKIDSLPDNLFKI